MLCYPDPSICNPFIIIESSNESNIIANNIPKEFLVEEGDTTPVRIRYKLVDGAIRVPPCVTAKDIKIECIQKR